MTAPWREVHKFSRATFADDAAALVAECIADAVRLRGECRLVTAGGRTPEAVYRVLAARSDMPWESLSIYFGDERGVTAAHAASNYRMVNDTLLLHTSMRGPAVFRMRGEMPAPAAAAAYDAILRSLGAPLFDVTMLGMGADGHTASLFPGDGDALRSESLALATVAPAPFAVHERITLSLKAINSSRVILLSCPGDDKRQMREAILAGDPAMTRMPAALVRGLERTLWLTDGP